MLTTGPISLDDLCSSALIRKDFKPAASDLKHSIVRFILSNNTGRDDIFTYPAERCEWYFVSTYELNSCNHLIIPGTIEQATKGREYSWKTKGRSTKSS
jgi:hypothetical protein